MLILRSFATLINKLRNFNTLAIKARPWDKVKKCSKILLL